MGGSSEMNEIARQNILRVFLFDENALKHGVEAGIRRHGAKKGALRPPFA
jgi:hypothetical protein